jgi:hypothetical protein
MVENYVKKVFTDPMKPRVKALKEMMNSMGMRKRHQNFASFAVAWQDFSANHRRFGMRGLLL